MKILVILPFLPYPLISGGHKATFYTIDYSRKYHNITLLCPEGRAKDISKIKNLWPDVNISVARVIGDDLEKGNKPNKMLSPYRLMEALKKTKYLISDSHVCPKPPKVDEKSFFRQRTTLYNTNFYPLNSFFIIKVCDLVERCFFDVIQVEFPSLLGLVDILPRQPKKVFVHHEIRFVRMEREMNTFEGSGAFERYLIEITKRQEIMLLSRYDLIMTLSEEDKIILSKYLPVQKIVTASFPMVNYSPRGERIVNLPYIFNGKIVFLGGSAHYPNFDAVNWFLEKIWERLLDLDSCLTFSIVGEWTEETKALLKNRQGVSFTGYVNDLADVMEGAIMVVPLRIGSGIRSKILDAISLHTPVVSTSIGKEGLPLEDGEECFIADDPVTFISKIKRIIGGEGMDEICSKALKKIEANYSRDICGRKRNEIYRDLIAS